MNGWMEDEQLWVWEDKHKDYGWIDGGRNGWMVEWMGKEKVEEMER